MKAAKRSSRRFTNSAAKPVSKTAIVFVEDYDTYIARRLVQGVDLWLNNPLRPLEASGTSGMKLPPNGGFNLSVLDGWWCEGYNGNNGWAIGAEIEDGTVDFQSEVDAGSLYQLLENQIIPLYYAKPDGKLPLAWLQLMRESIRSDHAGLQHPSHGEGIHRAPLHSGGESARGIRPRRLHRGRANSASGKRRCAKTGRRCSISDVQVGNTDRQNILGRRSARSCAPGFISAPSIRSMCASKRITAKADNGGIRNPTVTVLE